ncbi:SprT-like protein [Enterococcus sp. AZ109]
MEAFQQPFVHQASFNRRLKSTGGRYHLTNHNLDFNPLIYERYGMDELVKVIKHELCHYHLHLAGRGYQHKDREFKELLQQTGGSRYSPPLANATIHHYCCRNCGKKIQRRRKIDTERYVCGGCHGQLLFVKTVKPSF